MPAGAVVALVFADGERLAAVSRPKVVEPGGGPAALAFEPPAAGSGDLVVRVDYPEGVEGSALRDMRARVNGPAGAKDANAATPAATGSHTSIFYGLPAGRWSAEVLSEHWSAEPVAIDVAAGGASLVSIARLLPRPTLTVELAIDRGLESETRRLSLHRCAPGDWADSGRLDSERCPAAGSTREKRAVFSRVEARWHVLEVEIGGRRLRRAIDLRPGADVEEKISVEATRLSGRVIRGRRGVPAEIELECLESPGVPVAARAGSDGAFRAVLWPQGSWRAQVLPDRMERGDAAVFAVDAHKPGAIARDFELPETELRLALLDAKTKDPLPDASVAYLSFGKPRFREADDFGQVQLSGVPPGLLEVYAEAEGYRARQAALEVEDSGALQSFDVELSPLDRDNEFQAVLPSGAAAASAKVFVGATAFGIERERVDCDGEGVCRLAERPPEGEGMLLAHPDAGFTVLAAGQALSARHARFAPGGGILRLIPTRGETTADALLQVSVSIPGATLPPMWLDNLALAIARPSRTAVFPGARSGFFLPGLPAGAITVTITAARRDASGAFGPPAVVAGPIALELPATEAVAVELP